MKQASALKQPHRVSLKEAPGAAWRDRAGRLFGEFERPARGLVRRAFRGAFGEDEIDDIYANAWIGTLRALADRHAKLSDDEVRSYVLTAVANQAAKELRRRKRKPTTPLELDANVTDTSRGPEEQVADAEDSQITRDLLSSLPRRRRAVILLRYGWGLEPAQICALIKGLSPRAYRKEITRGVDDLAERMRSLRQGTWCGEREPLLKAFAAGLADDDQARQAKAHIAHCRDCSDFVARLSGHLHDLGSAATVPLLLDGVDTRLSVGERVADGLDRARETVAASIPRTGSSPAEETAAQIAASGGTRGAGAAGLGVAAKLASVGTVGKVTAACVSGGVAATACVAAGLGPIGLQPGLKDVRPASVETERKQPDDRPPPPAIVSPGAASDDQIGAAEPQPSPAQPATPGGGPGEPAPDPQPKPEPAPVTDPVAPATEPIQQEFGAPAAAAPVAAPAPAPSAGGSGGGSGGGGGSAVRQEFGP